LVSTALGEASTAAPTAGPVSVLLVEDGVDVARQVEDGLTAMGLAVETVGTGAHALRRCADVDAIVLDIGLPDVDGFEVCRTIRARSAVPILFLSGRSDEFDRVLALKMGADDYLVKPCSLRELAARIEAVIRRTRASALAAAVVDPAEVAHRVGGLTVDCAARAVSLDGTTIRLARKEFDLLALLVREPGKILTRDRIMLEVWGYDSLGDTRTLGVHVAGLRKKLGNPDLIETVRGIGFRIRT
jgi:DNA-binding response OmpR family regulator